MRASVWVFAKVCICVALSLLSIGTGQAQSSNLSATQQASWVIARPSSPNDISGWYRYLGTLVLQRSQDLARGMRPYTYFVPAGEGAQDARERQSASVADMAARRPMLGTVVAFAGPDSSTTAYFVLDALKNAPKDWAKGSILIFVGTAADKKLAFDAMSTSGATLSFVDMPASVTSSTSRFAHAASAATSSRPPVYNTSTSTAFGHSFANATSRAC